MRCPICNAQLIETDRPGVEARRSECHRESPTGAADNPDHPAVPQRPESGREQKAAPALAGRNEDLWNWF